MPSAQREVSRRISREKSVFLFLFDGRFRDSGENDSKVVTQRRATTQVRSPRVGGPQAEPWRAWLCRPWPHYAALHQHQMNTQALAPNEFQTPQRHGNL